MRSVEHEASTGRGYVYIGIWWGNLRERDHVEDPSVDGSIILNGS
jgi:hypothetical protein